MLNKPEFPIFFFGLFVSLLSGIIQPAFALLYSEMFKVGNYSKTVPHIFVLILINNDLKCFIVIHHDRS